MTLENPFQSANVQTDNLGYRDNARRYAAVEAYRALSTGTPIHETTLSKLPLSVLGQQTVAALQNPARFLDSYGGFLKAMQSVAKENGLEYHPSFQAPHVKEGIISKLVREHVTGESKPSNIRPAFTGEIEIPTMKYAAHSNEHRTPDSNIVKKVYFTPEIEHGDIIRELRDIETGQTVLAVVAPHHHGEQVYTSHTRASLMKNLTVQSE